MKRGLGKRLLPSILIVLLLLNSFTGIGFISTAHAEEVDPVIPEILITEIVFNPSGATAGSTKDVFEFAELYNASEHDVNLKDYKLMYGIGGGKLSAYKTDDITADAVLKPGDTAVIWLYNNDTADAFGPYGESASDFNGKFAEHYGVTDGIFIYPINADTGVSTQFTFINNAYKAGRTLLVVNDTAAVEEYICSATYNYAVVDTGEDESVTYNYPTDNSRAMVKSGTNMKPTPGRVTNDQIPVDSNDAAAPVIVHEKPLESMVKAAELKITASVTDETKLLYAKLCYETYNTPGMKVVYMEAAESDADTYEYIIPEAEISGSTFIRYYIEARDGLHTVTYPADKSNSFAISVGDVVAPEVNIISPEDDEELMNQYKPVINAEYTDASGIDTQSVKLYLNGRDVTENAAVSDTGISYRPGTSLADGDYTVKLEVCDKSSAKNKTVKTWSFTIVTGRPIIPEILMTELLPNATAEASTLDAFEFVELYNASNHDINLKDYKLLYRTDPAKPTTYLVDDITEDFVMKPGQTAVVWFYNQYTRDDYGLYGKWTIDIYQKFKEHYNTPDDILICTVKAYNDEGETGWFTLHNSAEKTLIIAKDDAPDGDFVCEATYNGSVDTKVQDTSVIFKYPVDSSKAMVIMGSNVNPTPGWITYEQKPINYDDPAAPVIIHEKPFEAMLPGALKITAKCTDETELRYVKLYYETYNTAGMKSVDMTLSQTPDTYEYTIPSGEVYNSSYIKYYIEASDGLHTVAAPNDTNNPFIIAIIDGDGPIINAVNPVHRNCFVNYYRPVIKGVYSDASGIDEKSVKLYLNGQDITANASVSKESIMYTPEADLPDGKYTIRLEVSDDSQWKNGAPKEWAFTISTTDESADYKIPEILITEVLANPTAGLDANNMLIRSNIYEFLELYNAGSRDINLKDYKLMYIPDEANSDNIKTDDILDNIILYPGQSAAVWIYNDKSKANFNTGDSSTLDESTKNQLIREFRKRYNMADGVPVIMVDGDSVSSSTAFNLDNDNTSSKTIMVAKDDAAAGQYICTAIYNDDPDSNDVILDKSITYTYPTDNGIAMVRIKTGEDPTPGAVTYEQVPLNYFDKAAPVIEHQQPVSSMEPGDLKISVTAVDETQMRSVKLYYKTFNTSGFVCKEMAESQDGSGVFKNIKQYNKALGTSGIDVFEAVIPQSDILGSTYIDYYIEASDGLHTASSLEQSGKMYTVSVTDTQGPVIKRVKPSDKFYVENDFRPVITVEYDDASGINAESVKLYLNDKDVTGNAIRTDSSISYTPGADLAEGEQTVRIEVSDNSSVKNKTVRTWTFMVGPEVYNHYKGQIHSHTNYSDGMGDPDEAYTYARDSSKVDFFGITDHAHYIDENEWKELLDIADGYNAPDSYATIPGFELTWDSSMGWWGHMNSYNTGWIEPVRNNTTVNLPNYYQHIIDTPGSISQFNHPGFLWGDFAEYGYYSEEADEAIDLMEVRTLAHEVEYAMALDKGWHISPSNNEDNHSGNWAKSLNATVVISPRLTRENLLEAIDKNRTYSVQDRNLQVMYKINNQVMGSRLQNPDKLSVSIEASHPSENIGNITVVVDGHSIAATKYFDTKHAEWSFELPAVYNYYYVRIEQPNGKIAVTAPIWVENAKPVTLSNMDVGYNEGNAENPVQIKSDLTNAGKAPITDVKVEYYKTNTLDGNKIGEKLIGTIGAGAKKVIVEDIPSTGSERTIYVKVTGKAGDVDVAAVKAINIPELLITEVVPKTSEEDGSESPFEFIEIYNNSDKPVDISDYRIEWYKGSGATVANWDITEAKTIQPKSVMVIWLKPNNPKAVSMTLEDFNARYGTSLNSGEVVEIIGKTLEDTGGKTLFISKDGTTPVKLSQARYNVNLDLSQDVVEDGSIQYRYPTDGTDILEKIASGQVPTPGLVASNQVPYAVNRQDAGLRDLKVDGRTVDGFSSDVTEYTVKLPHGTITIPEVTAETSAYGAAYTVDPALRLPGTTVVTVTAADGVTKKEYKIRFTVAKDNDDDDDGGVIDDFPKPAISTERIGGIDRIHTSTAIAEKYCSGPIDKCILTTGFNFPDALSGGVLSAQLGAPILLAGNTVAESQPSLDYIAKHLKKDGMVYILGGTGAVSDSMVEALNGMGIVNIKRLYGEDRYGTNAAIIRELNIAKGTPVILTTGENFPDSLSISSVASSLGYPILLSGTDSLSKETEEMLVDINPEEIYVIGGTGAVSDSILARIKELIGLKDSSITRIEGKDRYETSINIAKYFKLKSEKIVLATGNEYPDALSGITLTSKYGAPILLVGEREEELKELIISEGYREAIICGGTGVISDDQVKRLLEK